MCKCIPYIVKRVVMSKDVQKCWKKLAGQSIFDTKRDIEGSLEIRSLWAIFSVIQIIQTRNRVSAASLMLSCRKARRRKIELRNSPCITRLADATVRELAVEQYGVSLGYKSTFRYLRAAIISISS